MARRQKTAAYAPSEDDITVAVLEHWVALGVPGSLVASIPNKRAFGQAGLTKGLPDLMVITPKLGRITAYIELKREGGKLSDGQIAIRAFMAMRDIPYALCVGRDEPIRQLEEWGAVRRQAVAA
jgi:VRR-NUC domain